MLNYGFRPKGEGHVAAASSCDFQDEAGSLSHNSGRFATARRLLPLRQLLLQTRVLLRHRSRQFILMLQQFSRNSRIR